MSIGPTSELQLQSDHIKGDKDKERLESDVARLDGVRDVEVDTTNHTVTIKYDSTIVDESRLRARVEEAGYKLSAQSDRRAAEEFEDSDIETDGDQDKDTWPILTR